MATGKKIAILQWGSRGDCQPMAALGLALEEEGFQVKFTGCADAKPFFDKFGLDMVPHNYEFEAFFTGPYVKQAMRVGNSAKFYDLLAKHEEETFPQAFAKQLEIIKEYQPDLIVYFGMEWFNAFTFGHILKIPVIMASLQPVEPSKSVTSLLGEPCCHWWAWMIFFRLGFWGGQTKSRFPTLKAEAGKNLGAATIVLDNFPMFMETALKPIEPMVLCFSEICSGPVPPDAPKAARERNKRTGFWVINQEQQETMARTGQGVFGNSMDKLSTFLDAGSEPPIYMGWGSLVLAEPSEMASLAVSSLQLAGLRGVVLGGWAKLSSDSLAGLPNAKELQDYAAKNVLFIDAAPHEWLFPRCSVLVHHGGTGTTAAGFRAGVPCVVTPGMFDQFANAAFVEQCGVGVAMKQFSKVTPKDLSAAIKKCSTDAAIKRKAKDLGEQLQNENGARNAATIVKTFLAEEVDTGKWRVNFDQRYKKFEAAAKSPPGCLGFLAKLCCSSRPFD